MILNPCRFSARFAFFALALSNVFPAISHAANKVVVIPMAGDDISPESFMPVAPNQPLNNNYTIGTSTVVDKTTGLEWQKTDDNTTRTHAAAITYCSGLSLDGKADWRLPEILELQSIVDYNDYSAAINGAAFPGTNASRYWSASSDASSSANAWPVNFNSGGVSSWGKPNGYYVRCVR